MPSLLDCGLGDQGIGVCFQTGAKNILFSTTSRPAQPSIQWIPVGFSPRMKQLGREVDHSALSIAEFKNGGAIPPLPYKSS
jgi:hypothetical protein